MLIVVLLLLKKSIDELHIYLDSILILKKAKNGESRENKLESYTVLL